MDGRDVWTSGRNLAMHPTRTMLRSNSVIRQVPIMTGHFRTQFVAPMEDIGTMVAVCIELSMADAVGSPDPDISTTADEHDIAIDNHGDGGIVWHRLIDFLNNRNGRRSGRWHEGRRNRRADIRVHHHMALPVGHAGSERDNGGNHCKVQTCIFQNLALFCYKFFYGFITASYRFLLSTSLETLITECYDKLKRSPTMAVICTPSEEARSSSTEK
jgi:hypothetical protein